MIRPTQGRRWSWEAHGDDVGRRMSVGEMARTEAVRWMCEACGWIYDPDEGDPDSGVEPGTPFEDIPDDWMCPICGATKTDFRALEPGEFPDE